jgi:sulfur carrier protein ThiS adenylyltransferase
MNWTTIKQKIGTKIVGIAGCGGLGSNAAMSLARVGIRHFVLADFDVVEESNLNRQYYFRDQIGHKKVFELAKNIYAVDNSIQISCHDITLTPANLPGVFAHCDLIIEAFDKADAKQMLVETVLANWPEKPLILGVGMAGTGAFHLIRQEQWDKNIYICGDSVTEISDDNPPLAPRVCIVANMQANLALELLLRENNPDTNEDHTK